MEKATYIKKSDLAKLKQDKDGNYLIPEGIVIYIKEDPAEVKAKRIAELEADINNMTPPTTEQLIEEGKMMNHYYMLLMELDYWKNRI